MTDPGTLVVIFSRFSNLELREVFCVPASIFFSTSFGRHCTSLPQLQNSPFSSSPLTAALKLPSACHTEVESGAWST